MDHWRNHRTRPRGLQEEPQDQTPWSAPWSGLSASDQIFNYAGLICRVADLQEHLLRGNLHTAKDVKGFRIACQFQRRVVANDKIDNSFQILQDLLKVINVPKGIYAKIHVNLLHDLMDGSV